MIGESFYTHDDGVVYKYELKTDPPEAMFWATKKLKPSELKVYDGQGKQVFGEVKETILEEINNDGQSL
jgi:hypothetical protein